MPAAIYRRPPATPPRKTPQSAAQNIWPTSAAPALGYAATPKAPDGSAAALAPSAARAPVTTERVVDTDPNGILNGGHAVPAAMPTPVKPNASAAEAAAGGSKARNGKSVPAGESGGRHSGRTKVARPRHAVQAKHAQAVGSASWIAQLLAALGGAIAAGAVAWFLIRPAPERNYG